LKPVPKPTMEQAYALFSGEDLENDSDFENEEEDVEEEYDEDFDHEEGEEETSAEENGKQSEEQEENDTKKKELKKKEVKLAAEEKAREAKQQELFNNKVEKYFTEVMLKNYAKKVQEQRENIQKLFNKLLLECSAKLREQMARSDNWSNIVEKQSAYKLWSLIEEMCSNGGLSVSPEEDAATSRSKYEKIKQQDWESVTEYKNRFQQLVVLFEKNTLSTISGAEQAAKLINTLKPALNGFKKLHQDQKAMGMKNDIVDVNSAYLSILKYESGIKGRSTSGHGFSSTSTVPQGSMLVLLKPDLKCLLCLGKGHSARNCGANLVQLKNKSGPKCKNCGGLAHTKQNCTSELVGSNLYGTCCEGSCLIQRDESSNSVVILDPASDFHLFRSKDIVNNVDKGTPHEIMGHAGRIKVNQKAFYDGIEVLFSTKCTTNIIAKKVIEDYGADTFSVDDWGTRVVLPDGKIWDFLEVGNHLVMNNNNKCSMSHEDFKYMWDNLPKKEYVTTGWNLIGKRGKVARPEKIQEVYKSTTVAGNQQKYSKLELNRAQEAAKFWKNSAFKGFDTLQHLLDQGMIGQDITAQDLRNAKDIYGWPVPLLKGKTKERKTASVNPEASANITREDQIGYVDNVWIFGRCYQIITIKPMNMKIAYHLVSESKVNLKNGVVNARSILASRGLKMTSLVGDPQYELLKGEIDGLEIHKTTTDGHVQVAENANKVLKEAVRCVLHSLAHKMSFYFLDALVHFCMSRTNGMPSRNTNDKIAAKEKFTGRKQNFSDFSGFMDRVMVKDHKNKSNSMQKRTIECVALWPLGNIAGDWKFLNLESGKMCTSNNWTVMPIDNTHIERINKWSDKYGWCDPSKLKVQMPVEIEKETIIDAPKETVLDVSDVTYEEPDTDSDIDVNTNDVDIIVDTDAEISDDTSVVDINVVSDTEDSLVSDTEDSPPGLVEYDEDDDVISDDTSVVDINVVSDTEDSPPGLVEYDEDDDDDDDVKDDDDVHKNRVKDILESGGMEFNNVINSKRTRSGAIFVGSIKSKFVKTKKNKKKKNVINQNKALSSMKDKALDSMFQELYGIDKNGTVHPVDPNTLTAQELKDVIRSFMFLTEKRDTDGNVTKLKSRLVAMGNMQNKEDIKMDISGPTVSSENMYTIMAIAALEHRMVATCDISNAFVKADMPKNEKDMKRVIMHLKKIDADMLIQVNPTYKKFQRDDGSMLVELDKALYGCIQSARLWYNMLKEKLENDGFVMNPGDWCVFNKGVGDKQITIMFHVDDLMMTARLEADLDKLEIMLKREFKDLKIQRGVVHEYLGRKCDFSIAGEVSVTMAGKIEKIIADAEVTGTFVSPAAPYLFKIREKGVPLDDSAREKFHSLVQSLLYIGVQLRRDLLVALSFLTGRVKQPDEDDQKKLIHTLKYLNGTKHIGLRFSGSVWNQGVSVDASYALHEISGKSHSGWTKVVSKGAVSAKSMKQKIVTKSSTEAEVVALSDSVSSAIGWRNFLKWQGYDIPAMKIEQDNQACLKLMAKGRSTSDQTKHINIRHFFAAERMKEGEIELVYVPTEELQADIMTKPLQGALFIKLRDRLQNWESPK